MDQGVARRKTARGPPWLTTGHALHLRVQTSLTPETTIDPHALVFLVDVDDTLLDNDRFRDDLRSHLHAAVGAIRAERYWTLQEELFATLGYRDYLGAFQRLKADDPTDAATIWQAAYVLDYPFADRLYPGALAALAAMRARGRTVLLSDGDAVFQPRKLQRSGLAGAVDHEAMICVHKEIEVPAITARYPAQRYVLVDDKPPILTAFKAAWGDRVTTVLPRQGQFARDAATLASNPAPDVTIEGIGDLVGHPLLAG